MEAPEQEEQEEQKEPEEQQEQQEQQKGQKEPEPERSRSRPEPGAGADAGRRSRRGGAAAAAPDSRAAAAGAAATAAAAAATACKVAAAAASVGTAVRPAAARPQQEGSLVGCANKRRCKSATGVTEQPQHGETHSDPGNNLLLDLPTHIFISICASHGLSVFDLGALESAASHFRRRVATLSGFGQRAATLLDCAAEIMLVAHEHSWRVAPRTDDSVVYLLYILERKLWALQHLSAGSEHNLVISKKRLFAFGANDAYELGLTEGDIVQRGHRATIPHHEQPHRNTPQPVLLDADLEPVSVSASMHNSTCLVGRGELYAWGRLSTGQIGVEPSSLGVTVDDITWMTCVARPISMDF